VKLIVALAALAGLVAVGLLGWSAYTYRVETRPARSVEVESPERDLGEMPVGQSTIVFHVTNPTDSPAEVISVPDACGKSCCIKPKSTDRLSIPPGGAVDVVCELLVAARSEFEFSGNMFLNDNGLRTVKIKIHGVGVAPRADNVPPKQ
jgi:hypothetical protein